MIVVARVPRDYEGKRRFGCIYGKQCVDWPILDQIWRYLIEVFFKIRNLGMGLQWCLDRIVCGLGSKFVELPVFFTSLVVFFFWMVITGFIVKFF